MSISETDKFPPHVDQGAPQVYINLAAADLTFFLTVILLLANIKSRVSHSDGCICCLPSPKLANKSLMFCSLCPSSKNARWTSEYFLTSSLLSVVEIRNDMIDARVAALTVGRPK